MGGGAEGTGGQFHPSTSDYPTNSRISHYSFVANLTGNRNYKTFSGW